ncbi:MAG: GntR family transcriptional regulator [Comamonadaceae bacterium]|nr:MAG: GntR family transcriptional regulator [Comamonadaceae bacterium]
MNRLSETLREAIEEEVATGQLLPGAHLDESELAKRFNVSRTPIREALSVLAGEGLIELRPRRGAVVAQITARRLVEMFEVMAELEAMCVRLAVRRITAQELLVLEKAHEACRVAAVGRDPDAYFYANEHFHTAIYTASHNTFLSDQAHALQRKLRPYRRLQLRVRNRPGHSFAEHQEVLDAVRDGNTEAAVSAMRGHVLVQGERFADLLAGLSDLGADTTAAAASPEEDSPGLGT